MELDNRDAFIQSVVQKRSFLEVGGLWGEVNEKATVAFRAGATEIGTLDIWKPNSEWWEHFRARCAAVGLNDVKEFSGSVDNPSTVASVGVYDVVHCSGVLYHCPNPCLTISHLRQMTGEYLLLATAVMPPAIENEEGQVSFDADAAIFVPALSDDKRRVVDRHMIKAYGGGAYGVNSAVDGWFFSDGNPNYGPWWWLWTAEYVERLLSISGFHVVKSAPQFDGTGHLFLLRKTPLAMENYGIY